MNTFNGLKAQISKPTFVLVHSSVDTQIVLKDLDFLFKTPFAIVRTVGGSVRTSEASQRNFARQCLEAHLAGKAIVIHNQDGVGTDRNLDKDQLKMLAHYSAGYNSIPRELLEMVDLELVVSPSCNTHYWHIKDTRKTPGEFSGVVETRVLRSEQAT